MSPNGVKDTEKQFHILWWCRSKMAQPLWKIFWQFLKKQQQKLKILNNLTTSLLSQRKSNLCLYKNLHVTLYL